MKNNSDIFYEYHSEVEALIMDILGDMTDKELLDYIFSELDSLQEEYHNKLNEMG